VQPITRDAVIPVCFPSLAIASHRRPMGSAETALHMTRMQVWLAIAVTCVELEMPIAACLDSGLQSQRVWTPRSRYLS
jgi:hypothetical protein